MRGNDRPGAGVVWRKPLRGMPALREGSEVAPGTLRVHLLLEEVPQAPRECVRRPSPASKWSETCGAWSPGPAPGGLNGPSQVVPGEAPAAAWSELQAQELPGVRGTGAGPGCGGGRSWRTLAPPPAVALGASRGVCLVGVVVLGFSAGQYGHFLFAASLGPLVISVLSSVWGGGGAVKGFEGVCEAPHLSGFAPPQQRLV